VVSASFAGVTSIISLRVTCWPSAVGGVFGSVGGGGGLHAAVCSTSTGRFRAMTHTVNVTTERATSSKMPGK
jgi:hypothetical protein